MSDNEKFAVATHLSVLLRRKIGRTVDALWMIQNGEYALEILRVARDQADADIARLAERFDGLMGSIVGASKSVAPAAPDSNDALSGKYIGRLR